MQVPPSRQGVEVQFSFLCSQCLPENCGRHVQIYPGRKGQGGERMHLFSGQVTAGGLVLQDGGLQIPVSTLS